MTHGELESAIRRALNIFDKWAACTGAIQINTTTYYEIQGCIEDAVHCGAQAATEVHETLESEKD